VLLLYNPSLRRAIVPCMDPAASMLKTKIFLFQMTDQGGLLLASVNRAGLFHPLRSTSRERDTLRLMPAKISWIRPLNHSASFVTSVNKKLKFCDGATGSNSSSCSTSAWLISNIEPTFSKTFGLMRALLKTVTSLRRSSTRDDHIYCMKSDGMKWNRGNLTLISQSGSSGKARLVCVFSVGSRQGAKTTAVKNISADTWRRSPLRWSASLTKNGISTQIRPVRPTKISNQTLKRTLETRQRYSLRVCVSGKDPSERDDVAAEWDYI